MSEKPLTPWVVCENSGKVLSAHCHCMAGLGESCSHVASLLWAIEAGCKRRDSLTVWTTSGDQKAAGTGGRKNPWTGKFQALVSNEDRADHCFKIQECLSHRSRMSITFIDYEYLPPWNGTFKYWSNQMGLSSREDRKGCLLQIPKREAYKFHSVRLRSLSKHWASFSWSISRWAGDLRMLWYWWMWD